MMLEAPVPAKVNLYLRVTGRRADGYHELDSLITFVDVGERLQAEATDGFSLRVEGPFANAVPTDDTNLILRAAMQLAEQFPEIKGAAFALKKHIPVAAGLGGGSADAAAALTLLMNLYGVSLSPSALGELALSLGADVPVCLGSAPAHVSGIGEQIIPVSLPPLHLVLVNPGAALATADVFRNLKGPFFSGPPCDAGALATAANDLEPIAVALRPVIGEVLETLRALSGCRFARMSGSGPTCFGAFEGEGLRHAAAKHIHTAHPEWWVA